jgi:hypothetical protein
VHGSCRPGRVLLAAVLCGFGASTSARAEIVHLTTGATLSVRGYEESGDRIVLQLRAGGEIICDRSLVARITPDEVPFPEPEAASDTRDGGEGGGNAAGRFAELIRQASDRHGVDVRLLEAVIRVESNFQHRARSHKGAMGLMQLMPDTARQYAVADPYDPAVNIDAGARHLRLLLDRFDLRLALAAYNAGEGAVRRHGGVPPYPETRAYVARILRLLRADTPGAS